MSKPAVSIIIPTHGRPGLLREALDSVAQQTFRDYEVIVVDDGSPQPIADIAADHPTRPAVIRQHHLGPASARNRGIEAARAEMIAFLDSDDLWQAEKLRTFISKLETGNGARLYYGPMAPMDAAGNTVPGRTKPCHAGQITQKLFCSSFVHVPTVVCRKEVLTKVGGFDERLAVCEDYDRWLRVSIDEPFGLIPEPLARRRLHPNRLSKSHMSRNLLVKADVLRRFYESHQSDGVLDSAIAKTRLARVCFVAARAAFWNGQHEQAAELCQASRAFDGDSWRIIPLLYGAKFCSWLARGKLSEPARPALPRRTTDCARRSVQQ